MSDIQESNGVSGREKKILPDDDLRFSFTITYILLITTGTVTLIEALRTTDPIVRHVLNLETVVSIIAGYFYSKFVSNVSNKDYEINWKEIMRTRYTDWFITTPFMLLAFVIALSQTLHTKTAVLAFHHHTRPQFRDVDARILG